MSEQRTSKDRSLGPAPLPTFHGKGCICSQYPRKDCPALQTPEGQERERARELNSARCRLREAEIRWSEAGGEVARLRAVLKRMSTGNVPATDFVQLASDALVGSPSETTASPQAPIARITVKADRCYAVELYAPGLPPGEHDLYCEPEAVAPMMREKRAYYETHDPPHCPTCDCVATAGDWLTNEQCDDVIAFLEDYEWTGLTRENVRTWCTAIAEARSSVKAGEK